MLVDRDTRIMSEKLPPQQKSAFFSFIKVGPLSLRTYSIPTASQLIMSSSLSQRSKAT